jgi:periplasmic protein TonB
MTDALQHLDAETVQIKPNLYLVLGIIVSIMLHLLCVFILLGLPTGEPARTPAVTYVDLNAAQHPAAPMSVPPKEATLPKIAQKPQAPPPPAPVPAGQPKVQSPEASPVQPATPLETRVEEQRSSTIMGLGLTKGYFKSLGEGETLRGDIKGYYLEMLQGINEKWWVDQKLDKRRVRPIVVAITVARNGDIVDSGIVRGSGDSRYDRAVLAALLAASPLPPLPASYEGDFFQAPIRLVPPLNLMAW